MFYELLLFDIYYSFVNKPKYLQAQHKQPKNKVSGLSNRFYLPTKTRGQKSHKKQHTQQ